MKWNKNIQIPLLTIILVIFYTVGLIGLLTEKYHSYFLKLSFFNLILTFVLLLLGRKKDFGKFLAFLLFTYVISFLAEYLGSNYGYLFGEYSYGNNLGFKYLGVPIVIGLNWGILMVSSASIATYVQVSNTLKALIAGLLMTVLDYFIEPIAISSDYWQWDNGQIPIFNYICWFVLGFLLQLLYFRLKLNEKNAFHATIFLVMGLFFLILNLY